VELNGDRPRPSKGTRNIKVGSDPVSFLLGDLARERQAELRHVARKRPPGRPRRGARREGTPKQRLGWTLVEVGLKLATTPDKPRP
jgi:hypothetical protein